MIQCANFVGSDNGEIKGFSRDCVRLLPLELWLVRSEIESLRDYPVAYSYRVLWIILCSVIAEDCDFLRWGHGWSATTRSATFDQFVTLFSMPSILDSLAYIKTFLNPLIESSQIVDLVLYDDGDVEVLRLDKERWELVDNGHKPTKIGTNCIHCLSQENDSVSPSSVRNVISSFNLDDSQKAAILSCVATRECHHQNTVKLIWGPPGTGKTKTVGSLLFSLLKLKCRTLTCAPTNIAVSGVTAWLMSLVWQAFKDDTYGLGDIVLFGNWKRMKIDEHEDLRDVFLDYRVFMLRKAFVPATGWNKNLEAMICLLEGPKELYRLYLENWEKENKKNGEEPEETKFWR
ncbi:DNA-binding protein SMUBP-2 [Camellia lanceoleosa]|uniref:DNA-binding protein SMUBP-2 n=1 Tax=Camellia lanceoleosa TaxID=1840588 RepID=A0ACC0IT73_9ERIC|nr:DNA-binding protein SMUBP-2 [Camellia lanceoleosa]